MLAFQIAVSNINSHAYPPEEIQQIQLKFANIQTILQIQDRTGGRNLILQLTAQQLLSFYREYALALFIQNKRGRFFSLCSLQSLNISDSIICQQVNFYNDSREVRYKAQLSLKITQYKNPKVADFSKTLQRQVLLKDNRKSPIPQQQQKQQQSNKKIKSFLYTKQQKLKQLKPQSRSQKNWAKTKAQQNQPKSHVTMTKKAENNWIDDNFDDHPPPMQFTNEEYPEMNVPHLTHLQLTESHPKANLNTPTINNTIQSNNFSTFNHNLKKSSSPKQSLSQFEIDPTKKSQNIPKAKLRKMAQENAEGLSKKQNVMIPFAKGGTYELVPLSSLSPQQIIDYVQIQRKNQQIAQMNIKKQQKLQQQQAMLLEKNRLLNLQLEKHKQAMKKSSKQIKQIQIKQENEEDANDNIEQQDQNDEYMSDFESASVSNSAIRSRISSRGMKRVSKEQSSAIEDEYSQQFESYSQSMLSKTNQKAKAYSISDYSESISQSYRK